jgi:hypothetical protein
MQDLNVISELEFQDVYGLDQELLAMIQQPIAGVFLLFPITKAVYEY